MTTNRLARSSRRRVDRCVFITACASDDNRPRGAAIQHRAATTVPTTTVPATTAPPTTAPSGQVGRRADLAAAETAALTFVDSLGRGDIDAAARVVGPVSERTREPMPVVSVRCCSNPPKATAHGWARPTAPSRRSASISVSSR